MKKKFPKISAKAIREIKSLSDYQSEEYQRKKELKERQAQFCTEILKKISDMVSLKYWRGAEEHGGCLGYMSEEDLLKNIEEEAIDLLVYVAALKIKKG